MGGGSKRSSFMVVPCFCQGVLRAPLQVLCRKHGRSRAFQAGFCRMPDKHKVPASPPAPVSPPAARPVLLPQAATLAAAGIVKGSPVSIGSEGSRDHSFQEPK